MAIIEGYNMPDELYYHREHAWARIEEDGKVRVGMDDFFQKESGDLIGVDLPDEGDAVAQGEVCGKVQSSKWVGKLQSPVSGEIVAVNWDLEDESTLINDDPYGEGWIFLIEPSNLDDDLKNLFHGDQVKDWLKEEIKRVEEEKKK
ncbi:MAG: glycine cleavage system protein GcvH [Candidatus Zixiibacteriota bacterium]